MIGKYLTLIVLSMVFAVSHTAPRRSRGTPEPGRWKKPCGQSETSTSDDDAGALEMLTSQEALENIKGEFALLMSNYRHIDLEGNFIIQLDEHQYIPNQIPGEREVAMVEKLKNADPDAIVNYLPMFYSQLQTFAVAFEELAQDAIQSKNVLGDILITAESKLWGIMCELGANLEGLHLRVPKNIESFSLRPRDPDQDTFQRSRAWGVILKYKAYLEAWEHVLN